MCMCLYVCDVLVVSDVFDVCVLCVMCVVHNVFICVCVYIYV